MNSPILGQDAIKTSKSESSLGGKFSTVHVVAYIIAAVISRQYSGWQVALGPGFGSFIIAQVLTILGCICHFLCLMEIWSAVPFSGGNYALSRATLGFYLGFLDGVMEALVYIGHTSLAALKAGLRICIIFDIRTDLAPVFALCFYITSLFFSLQTNISILRRSFIAFATVSLLILLLYCFWSLKWSNFLENASLHRAEPASSAENWFENGWVGFVSVLPWTLQPYAGIRSFTLLTAMTENPKVTLPRAVAISLGVIMAVNILVVFVFASQPGGITIVSNSAIPPMRVGWSLIFNLSPTVNKKVTAILGLPATFARIVSYLIPGGVLLHSMGNSNLMPSVLMVNNGKNHQIGVLISAIFGMGFCVMLHYYPMIELFNLTVMGTMITDCTFLYGYILLKTTYSTVPREFVSPLGIPGAIFSICVFILIFISAAFYQGGYFGLKFLACLIGILTVYYFAFAWKSQTLCEEEDHVFMKLYVRNFNMAKKNKLRNKPPVVSWKTALAGCTQWCGLGNRVNHTGRVAADNYLAEQEPVVAAPVSPVILTKTITVPYERARDNIEQLTSESGQVNANEAVALIEIEEENENEVIIEERRTDGVEMAALMSSGGSSRRDKEEVTSYPPQPREPVMSAESVSQYSLTETY